MSVFFRLHEVGCFNGLKAKYPAEKTLVPSLILEFFSFREEEVAEEGTEQKGSLLLIIFTEQVSILLVCSCSENGNTTLKFPFLLVFTCSLKLVSEVLWSLHSTATMAPAIKEHNLKLDASLSGK